MAATKKVNIKWGKTKSGQAYPKRKNLTKLVDVGSILSSGKRIHINKKGHNIPSLEIENFEYSNTDFSIGFIVIDGKNWTVLAEPTREQPTKKELNLEPTKDGMAISPKIHNFKFIDNEYATGFIIHDKIKFDVTITKPEGDNN